MNIIYAKYNLNTKKWELKQNDLSPYYNELRIGFIDKTSIFYFDNLKFGFHLKEENNIKDYKIYPPVGVKYLATDQEYLVVSLLETLPEKNYELFLWVENSDIRSEKTFNLTIPRPKKPYKSWIWNVNTLIWEAPIPYPDDNTKEYIWNEAEQEWTPKK
jgi:hypothetical protein